MTTVAEPSNTLQNVGGIFPLSRHNPHMEAVEMAKVEFGGSTKESSRIVREVLAIEPVDKGRVPQWVFKAIKAAVKAKKLPDTNGPLATGGDALDHALRALDRVGDRWSDHTGMLKKDGVELLVSEPFAATINLSMLTSLEEFVELVGGTYLFSATSGHYPGETVRIIISPKTDSQ